MPEPTDSQDNADAKSNVDANAADPATPATPPVDPPDASPAAAPSGPTLLDVLERKFPASTRTRLREMVAAKRVLVDGRAARTLRQPIDPRASVEVVDRVAARARVAGALPFRVVHEDADLVVIDKPEGWITSSGEHDKRATVIDVVTEHYARVDGRIEVGLVHRLDKDASGLLVLSKNQRTFEALAAQFADRSAGRVYRALVDAVPEPAAGRIESKLVELADGSVRSTTHKFHGEPAITHYRTLERRGRHGLLEVRLETGRKHQIRAHLAEKGWPIAGDGQYNPHANQAPRLMLVAVELTLHHPRADRAMTWTIELPPAVTQWWDDPKRRRK